MTIKKMSDKIELWDLKKLIPYSHNSRRHPEKQIDEIIASIRRFGFTNPILIDTKSGIIAGHGRVSAAKKMNLEKVPVIVLDHLSAADKKAYIIADNKIAENSEWDFEMLSKEVADLISDGFEDLESIGFTQSEIDKLLKDETEFQESEEDEEERESQLDRVTVKVGDISLKIDGHRYLAWLTGIKKLVGLDEDKTKAEILKRLKIQ